MPDNNGNIVGGDILGALSSSINKLDAASSKFEDSSRLLYDTAQVLNNTVRNSRNMSQSDAVVDGAGAKGRYFRDAANVDKGFKFGGKSWLRGIGDSLLSATSDIAKSMLEVIRDAKFDEDIRKQFDEAQDELHRSFGKDVIGGAIRSLGKAIADDIRGVQDDRFKPNNKMKKSFDPKSSSPKQEDVAKVLNISCDTIIVAAKTIKNGSGDSLGGLGTDDTQAHNPNKSELGANRIKDASSNATDITHDNKFTKSGVDADQIKNAPSTVVDNNKLGDVSKYGAATKKIKGVPDSVADTLDGNKLTNISKFADVALDAASGKGDILTKFAGGAAPVANTIKSVSSTSKVISGLAGSVAKLDPTLMMLDFAIKNSKEILEFAVTAIQHTLVHTFKPAVEAASKALDKLEETSDRNLKSATANIKNSQERLTADVNSMVKKPFDILNEAASKWYEAWDNNLRTITATQGYTKDDFSALLGDYAARLRSEGLTSVVSSTDITSNLTRVLESGLSGTVAEEFAYLATKLNAAIPTQDFFSYAGTYASIAANAIRNGSSQGAAIAQANKQLEAFASNLLYASREIAGGFTTGLQNAGEIFEKSVQIAQASKYGNASDISGVLTSIAAIVGATAPDLATGIIDSVYKAALGGNSSEIVALRSLAGVNASNTEFLMQLTDNPKSIFSKLFSNLADMQNMSNSAYMEVAESLSGVFGVSMDAFARVDFNYLARAISSMDTTNAALSHNMSLLISGETTTNAEQMRMQQINEYMLDEGLAYVLDNEVARSIQEHMWDEQLAREMMEATYGVELQGSALELLDGIRNTVSNIIKLVSPFGIAKQIGNVTSSIVELQAQKADIRQLLELGKIGAGNARSMYNLITHGTDLNLTNSYISKLGGISAYEAASSWFNIWENAWNMVPGVGHVYGMNPYGMQSYYINNGPLLQNALLSGASNILGAMTTSSSASSMYRWGTVGKSTSNLIQALTGGIAAPNILSSLGAATSTTTSAQSMIQGNITAMLDSIGSYFDEVGAANASYSDWASRASKFGISDLQAAFESAGVSETSVKNQFESYATQAAVQVEQERLSKEEDFWSKSLELSNITNGLLESIYDRHTEFYDAWVDYFVNHTAYSNAYDHSSVRAIQQAESKSSEDAINALADALTQNDVALLDPTMQTNALLAQILKVLGTMSQQNLGGSNLSLPDTIAGLSLGFVSKGV